MNRLLLTFTFLCGILLKTGAQEVSGTVVDNQNRALEFVSVTLLQAADSSFVGGCVSDGQGRFYLPLNGLQPTGLLLKASSLSYKTIVMNLAAQTTGLQLLHRQWLELRCSIYPYAQSTKFQRFEWIYGKI